MIVAIDMHSAVKSKTLRERREALGLSQQHLAQLAGVSFGMVCMLDNGYSPTRSRVRDAMTAELDRLEAEREALGDAWELTPHIGRSGYRSDTRGPEAA